MTAGGIEILYLTYNRLNFTGLTWMLLMENTDWDLVDRLTVYDDGSEDGTLEFMREHIFDCPVEHELREGNFRSAPAIMNHFLATERAPLFAKVDSDICCPPGWLWDLFRVMRSNPDLILLGSEAGQTRLPEGNERHSFQRCSHIGGVGLMRTGYLQALPPIPSRGYFGWTEHQSRHRIPRGWICPDLMMPQIDRVPVEPWRSYTEEYIDRGWNRNWGHYGRERTCYWDWIKECR